MPVRKTSVYLPDALKQDLAALSRRSGRSEAQLIRLAVERLVRAAETEAAPGEPGPPRVTGPQLVGVGVGPSDPALVTARAVDVLRGADRVFAASTAPDAIGRAEAVVRAVAPEVLVERLVFDIAGDADARAHSLAGAASTIVEALDTGAVVAFVTLGDPNVYSTFPSLARAVVVQRAGVPVTTVPGIMAFQELAAATSTVLAEEGEHVVVSLADVDASVLDRFLSSDDNTIVLYKGGRHLPAVADALRERERLGGAVVGEMLGLPGGRSIAVERVADRPASYLATIVVPAVRTVAT